MTSEQALDIVKAAREAIQSEESTKDDLVQHATNLSDTLEEAVRFIDVLQQEMNAVAGLISLMIPPVDESEQADQS